MIFCGANFNPKSNMRYAEVYMVMGEKLVFLSCKTNLLTNVTNFLNWVKVVCLRECGASSLSAASFSRHSCHLPLGRSTNSTADDRYILPVHVFVHQIGKQSRWLVISQLNRFANFGFIYIYILHANQQSLICDCAGGGQPGTSRGELVKLPP